MRQLWFLCVLTGIALLAGAGCSDGEGGGSSVEAERDAGDVAEDAVEDAVEDAAEPDAVEDAGADAAADVVEELPFYGSVEDTEDRSCALVPAAPRSYAATVRWTSWGVPHVEAADWGSLAFGQAYAMARDHVCTLADQIVFVRSERSRWFGPGPAERNLNTDLGFIALGVRREAACHLNRLSARSREVIGGFVAGYNRYLEEVGPAGLPEACRGAAWVQPIDEEDLWAYLQRINLRSSGFVLLEFIGAAAPLATPPSPPASPLPGLPPLGSNGWAIGRERSDNGRGMLVSNTHFPWEGELRWHEVHLTIPDQVDVYGASLVGVPGVLVGFNRDVAWTHTVSASARMTLYRLEMNPDALAQHRYDGGWEPLRRREVTLEVLQPDGSLAPVTRPLYRSRYGPMVSLPLFGWTATLASTYRDANTDNDGLIDQWLAMDEATSLEAFMAPHRTINAVPWVNTIAVDKDGRAWYIDSSNVPNLSAEAIGRWRSRLDADFLTRTAYENRAFLLDGSDPGDAWVPNDDDGRPILPFAAMPQLLRDDFVYNANDSHWLTHPAAPLEGYSPLYGAERTERSLRTRMNLRLLTEGGADARFSLDDLEGVVFGDRGLAAELLLDEVLARCAGAGLVEHGRRSFDVGRACGVLGAWDRRFGVESVGAALWREWVASWRRGPGAASRYALPFDPDDPANTPRGLAAAPAEGADPVLVAMAEAMSRLEDAGVAIDAPLGQVQYTLKGEERVAVHGGQEDEGAFNIVQYADTFLSNATLLPAPQLSRTFSPTNLGTGGWLVNNGSSFILLVQYTDAGPVARAVTTYSQSSDPASPHHADQTRLFAEGQTRPVRFERADILADPALVEVEVSAPAP